MLVCDYAEIIETEVCGCTWGAEDEDAGLDSSHHGGDAYNFAAGKPSRI